MVESSNGGGRARIENGALDLDLSSSIHCFVCCGLDWIVLCLSVFVIGIIELFDSTTAMPRLGPLHQENPSLMKKATMHFSS